MGLIKEDPTSIIITVAHTCVCICEHYQLTDHNRTDIKIHNIIVAAAMLVAVMLLVRSC